MASLPIDDPAASLYTVGQVAGMLDVQTAFLRRLDTERLVCPSRSDGGQRRYSRNEIAQIGRVIQLANEGLNLEGIRRLVALEAEVADLKAQLKRARSKE